MDTVFSPFDNYIEKKIFVNKPVNQLTLTCVPFRDNLELTVMFR
jgi:hypothetical protein